jgi:L-threonylcarbamoyladenylate synthase
MLSVAQILPTNSPMRLKRALAESVRILAAGRLVAIPTETVYGLAANAFDARAVRRIFKAKGRPAHNPLIVHISSLGMARKCVSKWPKAATLLARAFWPGPLTMVLPKSKRIPGIITAGGDTVGLRYPSHPIAQRIIRTCGFPLAAPSANPSNALSPTTAEHVRLGLGGKIPLIVDGGACRVGIESTVVDLSGPIPRLLRPGIISLDELTRVLGSPVALGSTPGAAILRSPGMLKKHYSPNAKLFVLKWKTAPQLKKQLRQLGIACGKTWVLDWRKVPLGGFGSVIHMPKSAAGFSRHLYGTLFACDQAGAEYIVVQAPPNGENWRGVCDRLTRAQAT